MTSLEEESPEWLHYSESLEQLNGNLETIISESQISLRCDD